MLNQLLRLMTTRRGERLSSSSRGSHSFRGRFEHLETRAMLSATIGAVDMPVDTHIDTLTDTFLIVPPAPPTPEQLTQPIDVASTSPGAANGDGEPTGALPDLDQPQRAQSPDRPPQPLGWVVSSVTAVSQPTRTDFEVTTKIGNDGDPAHYFVQLPGISDAAIRDVEHLLAQYGAQRSVQGETPGLELQLVFRAYNGTPDYGFTGDVVGNRPEGEIGARGSKLYTDAAERYLGQLQSSAAAADDSLADSTTTAISPTQRSRDSAFQDYAAQLRLLPLDQSTTAGINSLSLADTHGNLDDAEGGFVALDGSVATDADLAQRTEVDAASAAIDAAIANLTGFHWSANGDAADQSSSANSEASDASALAAGNAALVDAAGQGGMVLLDSAASNGGDSISLAAAREEVPVDLSVPSATGKLEASVGVYQAFDVATADATTAAAPAAAATGTTTSAAKHEHDAKNHVSADKAAKPATDQASTWVEMFTAAAVIGATKKRKSRTTA